MATQDFWYLLSERPDVEMQGSATEQSDLQMQGSATEQSDLANDAATTAMDPDIVLIKEPEVDPPNVRVKTHHNRKPDIGLGILIEMPTNSDGWDEDDPKLGELPEVIQYRGEYIGHGKSKTAFQLYRPHALYDGKVLKVSKAQDQEPRVFQEANLFAYQNKVAEVTTHIYILIVMA